MSKPSSTGSAPRPPLTGPPSSPPWPGGSASRLGTGGAGGATSWTRCASPSGFTSTSRWETSTTCSSNTCATCTARCSSGWPSGSSSRSRFTSRGRCSSGSRRTNPGCSTGSPGSRRGAGLRWFLQGFSSPGLRALPREDRVEQIHWMRQAIKRRFGVEATGLWLTERVWEPELAADLAQAGVRYALVDDRHFLVSGFERERLHAPFWTESDGQRVALFPIDERLRYLIPFQPPAGTAAYLRELRARESPLAVFVDDGEKFGGWPGTKEWVYDRGWLTQFLDAMGALIAGGEIRLTTLAAALAEVPSGGLAYLPTASYREMEGWALPPDAASRLARLERDLGAERLAGPDGALVRGAHWRNFFVRYPESNRMHKKMQALSALCRRPAGGGGGGGPTAARRAIGRAQCNDAYWHGGFGGLYLPHLRHAIWHNLALAGGELGRGGPLAAGRLAPDGDGIDEIWIHSAAFSSLIKPPRRRAIDEDTRFDAGLNYVDVLTRRAEAYHELAMQDAEHATAEASDGAPSIHDIEKRVRLQRLAP